MLPIFITGLWIAIAAVRDIVITIKKIQNSVVVVDILLVGGVLSFVVGGILTLENLSCLLLLLVSLWRVVLLFDWVDMVVAAIILLHLLPLISLDLLFVVSVASVGVLMVIGNWFLIWWLFISFVDCIFN